MDKVNSKHGKARAWILWMSIPYGLSAVALFSVPAGATNIVQAVYIFITYNLCTTFVYTAWQHRFQRIGMVACLIHMTAGMNGNGSRIVYQWYVSPQWNICRTLQ